MNILNEKYNLAVMKNELAMRTKANPCRSSGLGLQTNRSLTSLSLCGRLGITEEDVYRGEQNTQQLAKHKTVKPRGSQLENRGRGGVELGSKHENNSFSINKTEKPPA